MKIKNISRKVLGNQSFTLLPGDEMEVEGTELWVKMYKEAGYIEVSKQEETSGDVGEDAPNDSDSDADASENAEKPEEAEKTADAKSSKGRGKKTV